MRIPFTLFFGIFVIMALSNAIVPVLPAFAGSSTLQGAIYSAYFLGALVSTLPGGILSDRLGRITVMRAGLIITVASGILLLTISNPFLALPARFVEGIGAGLFVAAGMSFVNSRPDHERMSGYYLALLNAGLVLGLVCAGWLSEIFTNASVGLLVFSALSVLPAAVSLTLRDTVSHGEATFDPVLLRTLALDYLWLWISAIILVGITGVIISLYPEFSDLPPHLVGFWIAGMSIATIVSVLVVPRFSFPPITAIRWSAVLMAAGAVLSFFSPAGLVVIGVVAGAVMIAQMAFLAKIREHQGTVMGLFSTASYLGMAVLPFLAGIVADTAGFLAAFCTAAACAILVTLTIGRCSSCRD